RADWWRGRAGSIEPKARRVEDAIQAAGVTETDPVVNEARRNADWALRCLFILGTHDHQRQRDRKRREHAATEEDRAWRNILLVQRENVGGRDHGNPGLGGRVRPP